MWTQEQKWTVGIGAFGMAMALFTVFYWIPTDVESGILEIERRDVFIGDGMAPFFLAVCIGLLGLSLTVAAFRDARATTRLAGNPVVDEDNEGKDLQTGTLSPANLGYLLRVVALIALSMAMMVWVGPLAAKTMNMLGFDVGTYRQLTNTFPYKYLGFVSGGFVLVFSLISLIEGKSSVRAALTAILTIAVLIAVYDGPFDQLLLPPNGG